MVVESSSAWLEVYDPFIGEHLEHSATIFAVVRHSMTLLCSVEQEHIGNSIGTMLHRNAPEVSFKHAAGTPVSDFVGKTCGTFDVCAVLDAPHPNTITHSFFHTADHVGEGVD
jgi:hypothetical protein